MANFVVLHEIGTKKDASETRAVLINLDLVKRITPPRTSPGYAELRFIDDPSYLLLVDESFEGITRKLEAVGAKK